MASLPNFACSSYQPSTQPGTESGSTPKRGISSPASARSFSSVSPRGERPLALRPCSFFACASHTRANRSPPIPQPVGSTTPSTAFAAMAASTALPPARSTSSPACVASGWLVATMPFFASTSERVTNGGPTGRSW